MVNKSILASENQTTLKYQILQQYNNNKMNYVILSVKIIVYISVRCSSNILNGHKIHADEEELLVVLWIVLRYLIILTEKDLSNRKSRGFLLPTFSII